MYLRFVIDQKDEDSGKRLGLFHALAYLCDQGELFPHEEQMLQHARDWFNRYLQKPTRFSRTLKPNAKKRAISWFKDSAIEHIAMMRELVAILQAHQVHVEMLQTDHPGYIVYEDEFQITAEAFTDTGA